MHFKYLPSFVKRRGRITKKQIENIEDLHKFSVSNFNDIKNISEDFTSTTIEIGFGDGENIFSIAKGNPETLFVGSEVYLSGIGSLIGKIKENNLLNIRIHNGDVRELLETIKVPIFKSMLIICPDPWQKAKHHKRRLINSDFLALARNSLKKEGDLYIATDWEDYADGIYEAICDAEGYISSEDFPFNSLPVTRFQARAIREGRDIHKFNLKKI